MATSNQRESQPLVSGKASVLQSTYCERQGASRRFFSKLPAIRSILPCDAVRDYGPPVYLNSPPHARTVAVEIFEGIAAASSSRFLR